MKLLTSQEEINNAKWTDLIKFECEHCNKEFERIKNLIQGKNKKVDFCSKKCHDLSRITKVKYICKYCNKEFYDSPTRIKEYNKKRLNIFCSISCSSTYNNLHRKCGSKRSKLEVWLENQLKLIYNNLEINFNKKDAINSELDIYIPSLSLAFELNGEYHYEPIRGEEKLKYIQNNDARKFQACLEKKIELCIIDTCGFNYFKEEKAKHILEIVLKIINQKLNKSN